MNEQTMAFGVTLIALAVFAIVVILGFAPMLTNAITIVP